MLLDDFFSEYWSREETLEEVWGWVLGRTHGHLHLAGPAGCGKSWLLRGLAVGSQERGALPLYVEKSPEESFSSVIWRLVDSTEFLLDTDTEGLRLSVSQAFYEGTPQQALLAAMVWLTQEVESSFLILLDGFEEAAELAELPAWREFPEGVYLVTGGRARHPVDQLVLRPEQERNRTELEGYILRSLSETQLPQAESILQLCRGNWRWAYYYLLLLKWGVDPLPQPENLFESCLEVLSKRVGSQLFRTVHLEVLLLLAVAQVPASLELLRAWGLPAEQLGFALFELRDLLSSDGDGSQYDALFTGEHYSIRSPDLRDYLLEHADWRDRVADCHRRVVARALESSASRELPAHPDADFYALAFAQYHLREGGRLGDLQRLFQDPDVVERCWALGRAAREQGYEEIGLQLFLVAGQMLEARREPRTRRFKGQLAEIYADCCHALTNQGRYSDGAHFGEQAVDLLRPLSGQTTSSDPIESLLTHCLLSLADPYLYMGYVQRAYPLYAEALERSQKEPGGEQARSIHSLRGLARSSRALGRTDDSLRHGQEALELARKLTRDEGEEWAQYLFELLMEQSETLRNARSPEESPLSDPLEVMGVRWESLRLLREAEELYSKFSWPGDQELVFLYLEQSMALFDLEKWAEAEERLSRAIEVINSLPAGDSNPADVASLEFLRSHALALMNRIGEASGSLANLLTPELMKEMDISEQALVLFFRGKILSHQGLLKQAEAALEECIKAYQEAIGVGAEDLLLEQLSARCYLARVAARRGRLSWALEQAQECKIALLQGDGEEIPWLEVADACELAGWIHQSLDRWSSALSLAEEAQDCLRHLNGQENETDIDTEQGVSWVTQALALSGMGRHAEAIEKVEKAVEMERRRAQEGYELAHMWCALHRLALARLHRAAGQAESALEVALQALAALENLPGNQLSHLGLHVSAARLEIALASIALERWDGVRQPLLQALATYENEMWQGKEYLVATLLDGHRHWLDFCRQSANRDWQDRKCWKDLFEAWARWSAQLEEEKDNEFLQQALTRLSAWVRSLTPSDLKEWDEQAPLGLRSPKRNPALEGEQERL